MNAYTELARLFKQRDNPAGYSPVFGKIISLPNLKIQLSPRVIISAEDIISIFDLYQTYEHDGTTEYVNINKQAVLLPYSDNQKFIAIGVVV